MKTLYTTLILNIILTACGFGQKSNQTKDTPSFGKSPDYLKKIDSIPLVKLGPSVIVKAVKHTKSKLNKDTSAFAT